MNWLFTKQGADILAACAFGVGIFVGMLANRWAIHQIEPRTAGSSRSPSRKRRTVAVGVVTGLLFAAYVLAAVRFDCQQVPEVRPDVFWKAGRIVYHLILITLLVTATATDMRECLIPDAITVPGTLVGLTGAVLSGQLQMIHIWVDWNQEIPGIAGPFIPAWLDAHRHLHGLAWSATGAVVGGGLTWFVRRVSSLLLRREALGLGDVTLMAMIGSFLGWQPIVMVFFLAPMCGLAFALPMKVISGGTHLPYGPFLATATVIVLFAWRPLWLSTRLVFGHPLSLVLLSAGAAAAFVALLAAVRFFRTAAD
jgi:leader peptidase (prepilin peptidase) / N-methyltransferase